MSEVSENKVVIFFPHPNSQTPKRSGDPRLTTAVLEAELTPGLLNADRRNRSLKNKVVIFFPHPNSQTPKRSGDPRLTTALLEAELTPGLLNADRRNRSLKNPKDHTGIRNQNLPSGGTVPQQTVPLSSHDISCARKFKSRSGTDYSLTSLWLSAMK